jgi:outer membrane protein assembly factor BamB
MNGEAKGKAQKAKGKNQGTGLFFKHAAQQPLFLPFAFCLLPFALVFALSAATTSVWEMSTYKDFAAGTFQNVSLSREGRLTMGPELKTLFATEQALLWSVARASDGFVYVGTGHRGRVFRVAADGKSTLFWTAAEPEVFALAVGPEGDLYAGTSPDGKIYKINRAGQTAEFFNPQTKYIWSLAFAKDGTLYAGTGDRGKVFRIDRSGKGEVYFDSGQGHVTSLALDPKGLLLAGSDPNGLLYRIAAKDKAFVLYDSPLAEIRAIEVASDGTIYAAAMGGAASKLSQGSLLGASDMVVSPVTSITVTATPLQGGPPLPKPQPDASKSQQPATAAAASAGASPLQGLPGAQKSALLRITPDNSVETLWTSNEENIFALVPQPSGLLFSTDDHGRIYRLEPGHQVTLVAQPGEDETTRLLPMQDAVLAATSNLGKLYRLGDGPATTGTYEAPVRDAGAAARWGKLSWRAQLPPAASIEFSTRSGNSSRPDSTWSDWSGPLRDADGSTVPSPNARYIQWRAMLHAAAGQAPVLESVSLPYLPQNAAPLIKSITVIPSQMAASKSQQTSSLTPTAVTAAPSTADYSITVTDTAPATISATNPGTSTTALSRTATQIAVTSISWQAEDPDNDKLTAEVSFRGEGENEWKLIKDNLSENYIALDADALADGVYQVKVVVSDAASNPPGSARQAEMISAPFLIDNTPPVVRYTTTERSGDRRVVKFEARDAASMLRRAEYSLDAGPWVPVYSDDGIIDSKLESFSVTLDKLKPGEHLIALRVFDSAGNAGLGKTLVK